MRRSNCELLEELIQLVFVPVMTLFKFALPFCDL